MIADLIGDLHLLRSSAGQPSLSAIEKRAEKLKNSGDRVFGVRVAALPRSTVHDLLRRARSHSLRPELVESIWAVLLHIAAERGRTPDRPESLLSLDTLRRRLEAINLPERAAAAPPPAASEGPATSGGPAGGHGTGAGPHAALHPFGRPPGGDDEDAQRQWLLDAAEAAPSWWPRGAALVPEWLGTYLTLEPEAEEVRAYAPHSLPGLLQTPDYAYEAYRRERPGTNARDLAALVHLRMRRQEPLRRPDALRLWAVIDESVLRNGFCGPRVMRDQLGHLIALSGRPNVTVQVMPLHAHGHDATGGPLTLLRFPERGLPDIVFVEQHDRGLYPHKSGDVSHYREVLVRLAIEAMPPEESIGFLEVLRADWPE
ncbi:DUF5753 domain-containing protein [Actinomadura sp. 21ATH]|uniref:DUF5753 domain-containing protein n=1 Tax=Actinomadura sp. 21ATH TaxID=1735444 RepID=UPI0035C16FF1